MAVDVPGDTITTQILNMDPTIMTFDETTNEIAIKYGKPGLYNIEIIL